MGAHKKSKPARPGQFRSGRRPHNAKAPVDRSLKDLVLRLAIEPREVIMNGEARTISRAERVLRLTVGRAIEGNVRDMAQLLKMMIGNPDLGASVRTETIVFINGALANV